MGAPPVIIDCHAHFTTEPAPFMAWRKAQLAHWQDPSAPPPGELAVSDDDIREGLEGNQLRLQRERGIDLTILSPRAAGMAHHLGDEAVSLAWARASNDLVHRATELFPDALAAVCQLPQVPGVPIANAVGELRRCIEELGFVGCNLNPDPSGGHWSGPPLIDRAWWPIWEALVALEAPAMIHVSGSCNPNFHHTGAHYINADTTAFMQLIQGDLFRDFPTLQLVIPHGGGAVPYHWGRYRGLAQMLGRPPLSEHVMRNVCFDTCVYHQAGIDCLFRVIDPGQILFASEMMGAVTGLDPETGHRFDDTRRYVEALPLSEEDRRRVYAGNVRRVYPRLDRRLRGRGL
jgi:4-oxalmesaconate hydratase